MKFVADVMLGRLAKRLRLLGFDVSYDPASKDNDILRTALEQDRLILTRDRGLAARPLAKGAIMIESDALDDQVDQVTAIAAIPDAQALTRCSACNGLLEAIPRDEVRDLVPDHVFVGTDRFLRCQSCGKVYWKGSHVRHMGLS